MSRRWVEIIEGRFVSGTGDPGTVQEDVVAVPFTFAAVSPMILAELVPGQIVDRAVVVIETVFDGESPTLALGTFADPGAILAAGEIDAKSPGQYETDVLSVITVPDFLILTITPSGSAQGAGLLFYKLKR